MYVLPIIYNWHVLRVNGDAIDPIDSINIIYLHVFAKEINGAFDTGEIQSSKTHCSFSKTMQSVFQFLFQLKHYTCLSP